MRKRVFIIHGWDGYPEEGWFPWLKRDLERRGFSVLVPAMPDTARPNIRRWVSHLAAVIGETDDETYLVGHSIGCQAILRYLAQLPHGTTCGGVVLVAGWTILSPPAYATDEERAIARPWIETPIDWDIVRQKSKHWTVIFSDNDDFVPIESADVFRKKLGAKIIMEHGKGHFSGSDDITELPNVRDAILKYAEAR